jgi:hypothetical protein
MMESLVTEIDRFCEDWMASEAGKAWLIDIEKGRYISVFYNSDDKENQKNISEAQNTAYP